ncbi:MAG: ferrochelatase [Alphaproteobacteria bacterium]|nr:ferrochelatase [Alphaproteobacteria bacterium SS10]
MTDSANPNRPFKIPSDHPAVPGPKTGVLLINLGTPDATSYWPMRRYLKEFLSDPRVIELSPWLWQPILNLIILTTRPGKSGEAYASIWDKETNESPLRRITREQTEALAARLAPLGDNIEVEWGMRYGNPSIKSRLEALKEKGCDRIVMMALYPQYSASTMATAYDKAFDALKKMRWQPAVRTMAPYHDDPVYVEAIAKSLNDHLATLDWEPEVILSSFHGVPKSYLMKGDPYHCQCAKSARLIREHLGMDSEKFKLTFQSRFGPQEWLQPYTDKTIEKLAQEGVKKMAVITPGFSSDCVETLEEIAIEGHEIFEEHGGTHYTVVPCLNQSEPSIDLMVHLAKQELAGWVPADQLALVSDKASDVVSIDGSEPQEPQAKAG